MKSILLSLLLTTSALLGDAATMLLSVTDSPSGGAGPTYYLKENFDGAGTPSGWATVSGNFDTTASPAPLAGTQSLSFASNGSGSTYYADKPFGDVSSGIAYGRFMIRLNTVSNSPTILRMRDEAGNDCFWIVVTNGGAVRIGNSYSPAIAGAVSANGTWGANATYYCWWSYVKGTGSNAQISFTWSPLLDKSTGVTVSTSIGTSTFNPGRLWFSGANFTNSIFDEVIISDQDPGNTPY